MSTEHNKAIAVRFYDEIMSRRNYDVLPELVCEDFVEENPPSAQQPGRDGLRRYLELTLGEWTEGHWTVEDMVAEGETVAVRLRVTGAREIEPKGRIDVEAWSIDRFRDGKIASTRFMIDRMAMQEQLGARPDDVDDRGSTRTA